MDPGPSLLTRQLLVRVQGIPQAVTQEVHGEHLELADGDQRTAGYTEASRGCKHMCRHCPIVPVYGGRFRVIQRDVVLEDVRRETRRDVQEPSKN